MLQLIGFSLLISFSQSASDCGQLGSGFFSNRQKRMIGGRDVKAQDFPWIVRVEIPGDAMWRETCTGTMITDRHLLTTARSFVRGGHHACDRKQFAKGEEPYICHHEDSAHNNCTEDRRISIKKVHLLDEYIASTCHGHFDIVVAELERPVPSSSKICLPFPNRNVNYERTNGTEAHILGYSKDDLYLLFGTIQPTLIDKFLVSPFDAQVTAFCAGDFGGPMFEIHNNSAVLTGVNVFAEGICVNDLVSSHAVGRAPRQYSLEVKQHLERIFNVIASGL